MQVIDLSHRMYEGLKTHDSHPRIIISDFVTHAFSKPRYEPPCQGFATKQLIISDHAATHVDAPAHFYPQGATMERQALDKHLGPALLLDVSAKDSGQPVDGALLHDALEPGARELRQGDIALIRAWRGEWGSPQFHAAAGLSLDGAQWLVARGIKAVGIDLGNIEDNADMTRRVHLFLLEREIPIYENLANLDRLPPERFFFVGLPLNMEGATGSPVRAAAIIGDPLA